MAATPFLRVDATQRDALLDIAVSAIEYRLSGRGPSHPPDLADLPTPLALAGSSFVSLQTAGGLRGCCGTLEPLRALAHDVWRNAQASAFGDPRFQPLAPTEWPAITEIEVSVLSGFERIEACNDADLASRLVPGVDGLVLAWHGQRATFLPKVWEQIADAREFLARLKEKAGWSPKFWAPDMDVLRYHTECMALERPAVRRRLH